MASARRRRDADHEFRETIGRVLRCITADGLVVLAGRETAAGRSRVLGFRPERARLSTAGGGRLFLYVEHAYALADDESGQPRVSTASYVYNIFGADGRRILGWHYHPRSRGEESVPIPHLHVYIETDVAGRSLSKLHLPTSRVALEDVVTFLVDGLGVAPREGYRRAARGEPRWRRILRESRAAFVRLRSWA